MNIGVLDTDSEALGKRLEIQQRLSNFDLNAWIFAKINLREGERWLDLGCGRGNQTLPLARVVGSGGSVTAVDLSEDSLKVIDISAAQEGTSDRIETIHSSLDEIDNRLAARSFDGIVGSYSLYYAADPDRLFRTASQLLNRSGRLFFCGPADDNNLELRRLIGEATGNDAVLEPTRPSIFMESQAPDLCRKYFGEVEKFEFENEVVFKSADDLITYWSSHNLHNPAFDEQFAGLAKQEIERSAPFVNHKRGIGIRAARPH